MTRKQPDLITKEPQTIGLPLKTLVINLDRRKDRWEDIQKRLNNFTQRNLLTVERLVACDAANGDSIPEAQVGLDWTTDRNAKYDGRAGYRAGVKLEMTAGERG